MKLNHYLENVIDYRGKTPPKSPKGIPLISAANVKGGKVVLDGKYVTNDTYKKWTTRGFIKPGDILITTEAPTGEVAQVPSDQIYLITRRVIALQVDLMKANEKFVKYYFLYLPVKKSLVQLSHGTTVPRLYKEDILDFDVNFPKKENQDKISTILSNYDNLIENNEKRITILENIAKLIYEEWFVKFRFPGHENVKMVDSDTVFGMIPEGWRGDSLGKFVEIKRGKTITKNTISKGEIPVVAGGLNPAYYHNLYNVKSPAITISASGANAGFTKLYFENIWASDCSYLNGDLTNFVYYCYLLLKSKAIEINSLQRGSAQPHVYPKDLMNIKVIWPTEDLLDLFERLMEMVFGEISILNSKNQNLKKTRDLLLPKLISGKISVEHLDIEIPKTLKS